MDATEPYRPKVYVLGGPNGAGKTTSAASFLPSDFGVTQFVNADTIASGLAAFDPESVALQAGRIMLTRLEALARQREDFAFETTLASRSFAPFLAGLRRGGYLIAIVYVWLHSPDLSVRRVGARVQRGGHHVPEETVRRRYRRGLVNFMQLYRPLADVWILCDNSGERPMVVARGDAQGVVVANGTSYDRIERAAGE